jgi:branched-subunit amino acid aminotransferase/4-amino-4-deoxychorismate lyase
LPVLYLNGRFVDQQDAAIDPLDRGLLLGDGLFETIRCEEGQLLFHVAHFARLGRNARLLEIPWSMPPEELLEICQQILDANRLPTARLRITLTRGETGGSPDIGTARSAPTLLITAFPFEPRTADEQRQRGWTADLAGFPLNHRSPLSLVKSTSYQEHVLARHFARRNGYDEAIMLNSDGLLAEGAMTNLFLVREGEVVTPPVEDGALPGIMRLKLGILCARLGLTYREESLTVEDLRAAEEAFLSSVMQEVMPLIRLGDKILGSGGPGPIAQQLQAEHRRDVSAFLHSMRRG